MSAPDAITASVVSAGSPGIRLLTSCGQLPSSETSDHQRLEQDDPPIRERIRQALVADKSLSLYAHNIEIVVGPTGVTLFGPVKSQEERKRIESGAAAVVKGGKVFSKLVVRPSQNFGETKSLRCQAPNEEPRTEEECGRIRRLWGIRERPR